MVLVNNRNMVTSKKKIWLNNKKVTNRPLYFGFKRLFDLVASIIGLVVLSPIFLIISLLIKFDGTHSGIFYVQNRVGKNGKKFKIYKFRSMIPNADASLNKLVNKNEVEGPMFKIKDDPRITKVGKFIRKYSLDELPQLLNVIKGDMSLVGPRPPLPKEVRKYSKYDKQRLLVLPGCTGLWQTNGRSSVGFKEMVELDLNYIKNSSFSYDLKIIMKTLKIMLFPNEAY